MTTIEINTLVTAVISYGLGFLSGYCGRGFIKKIDTYNSSSFILIIVSIVWAISVIVDMISPAYETSPLIHGLMGAIVGYYYKNKYEMSNNKIQE